MEGRKAASLRDLGGWTFFKVSSFLLSRGRKRGGAGWGDTTHREGQRRREMKREREKRERRERERERERRERERRERERDRDEEKNRDRETPSTSHNNACATECGTPASQPDRIQGQNQNWHCIPPTRSTPSLLSSKIKARRKPHSIINP